VLTKKIEDKKYYFCDALNFLEETQTTTQKTFLENNNGENLRKRLEEMPADNKR
jgi:hypothetical protein